MKGKGAVFRGTILFGAAVIGFNFFGGALYSKYTSHTPEEAGQGDGTWNTQMMEIDSFLWTQQKREDYFKKKKERLNKVKSGIEDEDISIMEDLEDKPGVKGTRTTPTIDPESRVKRGDKDYM